MEQKEKTSKNQYTIVSIIIQTHQQSDRPKWIYIESDGYICVTVRYGKWIQIVQIEGEYRFCNIFKQRVTTKQYAL